jgi:hypothetical protein
MTTDNRKYNTGVKKEMSKEELKKVGTEVSNECLKKLKIFF